MASYVPNYAKKRRVLCQKERKLRRLVERGASLPKVIAAVEDVRASRKRVLSAQRATIPPSGDAKYEFAKIDDKIRSLLEMPIEEILSEFGYRLPHDANDQC